MASPQALRREVVDSLLPIHPTGSAKNPPLQNAMVQDLKCVRKQLIINEIFVEATGVELASKKPPKQIRSRISKTKD
jgi:hypothetical protein